jgi:hypothetical protein
MGLQSLDSCAGSRAVGRRFAALGGALLLFACGIARAQLPQQNPVAILRDSTPTPIGNFGFELATDGRRLAVACPMDRAPAAIEYGSVTIFDRDPASAEWRETGVVIPWQASPSPPQTSVLFGGAIAIDGSRPAICSEGFAAPGSAGSGRVFMFEETSPGTWWCAPRFRRTPVWGRSGARVVLLANQVLRGPLGPAAARQLPTRRPARSPATAVAAPAAGVPPCAAPVGRDAELQRASGPIPSPGPSGMIQHFHGMWVRAVRWHG